MAREENNMTTLYGIKFPYTKHSNAPPMWPASDSEGRSISPGYDWWTCENCGGEVFKIPAGGDGYFIDVMERMKPTAFEFHARNCKP